MMRRVLLTAVASALPTLAGAQATKCQFDVQSAGPTVSVQLPSKQYNTILSGGVTARCPKKGMVLKSDSLEIYGDEGRFYFVGHVNYSDPKLKLVSDFLTYFSKDERVFAFQNMSATLPTGSKLAGPSLEYFRAVPKLRPQQHAVALGRPTMSVIEKDAQGRPGDPVTITGDAIWLERDSVLSSQGSVIVVRPELTATGDSLYLDGGKGLLRIMRKPSLLGTKGRPFTLVGETIDLLTRRRKLERVLAINAARAVSEDLTLTSDMIDLRIIDDQLQRAFAFGTNRAHAVSPAQSIVSDSIDVLMPGQRVREMHAVRGAVAEATPDTSHFKTKEMDRLTGDTIVAHFDSIPPTDTVTKPRIRDLRSVGHATSYQHLAAQDSACHKPAINYVKGRVITVRFESGRIKDVTIVEKNIEESQAGLFQPLPSCGADERAVADSVAKSRPAGTPTTPVPNRAPAPNAPPVGEPPKKP